MTSQLFVVLPSNSKAESYPNNTTSEFTIPLPKDLNTPQWKVGLLEIQIPITFYNIDDTLDQNYLIFENQEGKVKVFIDPGLYSSGEQIVAQINKEINKHKLKFREFEYDLNTHKVKAYIRKESKITFSPRLARILSLPETIEHSIKNKSRWEAYKSQKQVDPWIDFYSIYIYIQI